MQKRKVCRHTAKKYQPPYAVRTSMTDYREEDWMVNLPLYAIENL